MSQSNDSMNGKKKLTFSTITHLLTRCKKSINGRTIIYSVEATPSTSVQLNYNQKETLLPKKNAMSVIAKASAF